MQEIRLAVETRQANKWFFIFCFFYLLAWTLQPSLIRTNVPFDAVEGVAWGNLWLFGYEKHPPLAAWLTACFTDVCSTVGWPIYLLSQLSVVTCFWAMWRLAKKVLMPWQALIAVVMLSGVYYYNISAAQFNPNTLMLATWALTSLCFYNALQEQKIYQWLLVGIFSGLAMMTKYQSLLLFLTMLVVLIGTEAGRKSFRKLGVYLAFLTGFLIWLPNLIWLAQHDFIAITYASSQMERKVLKHVPKIINHLYQPTRFLIEQLGAALPALLLLTPFYFGRKQSLAIDDFNKRFFLLIGLSPLAITLLIALFTGRSLYALWAYPFLSFLGILVIMWLQPAVTNQQLRRFAILVVALSVTLLAGRSLFLMYDPYISHKTTANNFPGQAIANAVSQYWHQHYQQPLPYVAGDHTVVIHSAAYSKEHPRPYYFDDSGDPSPWIDENQVRIKGAVFVMRINEQQAVDNPVVKRMLSKYPQIHDQQIVEIPVQTKAKFPPIRLWMGILPASS